MKKLKYLTLCLTLLLTSFTFTTYAANDDYDDPILQVSNNNITYDYSVRSYDSRLFVYIDCEDNIRRDLKIKVKFYDFDGHYITTYEAERRNSTYVDHDFYRPNWLTAKIYYYVDGNHQKTKSVHR